MPARCGNCGKPPRSYFVRHEKGEFRTRCQHCGTDVAWRHGRSFVSAYVAAGALTIVAAVLLMKAHQRIAIVGAAVALFVLIPVAHFWTFQTSQWDPVQPPAAAPPAPPPAL